MSFSRRHFVAVARILADAAKYPEQRHQDARELARELDAVLAAMARPGWRRWLAL